MDAVFCTMCPLNFPSVAKMKMHRGVAHFGSIACVLCDKNLATKSGTEAHLESVHKKAYHMNKATIDGWITEADRALRQMH